MPMILSVKVRPLSITTECISIDWSLGQSLTANDANINWFDILLNELQPNYQNGVGLYPGNVPWLARTHIMYH